MQKKLCSGLVNQDITIETGNLDTDYTILLFYQGECPLCEDALIDPSNKYKRLAEKNIRVIGISADKTEQGFQKKLAYHQWSDNYYDFTGMSGENFTNYGVLGVPTFFSGSGRAGEEKTAMVDELMTILDKKNPVDPS
jgi:peroxiredoxin